MKKAELAYSKKSNSMNFDDFYKDQLFSFSKEAQKNHSIKEIIDLRNEDVYGNTKTFSLKTVKTENKFDLLKLFKPGDLLSNVLSIAQN